MELNRKQFIGTMFATVAGTCLPSFGGLEPDEFTKCKNDILYFVDNYLVVDDPLYGKLKMSDQQREYLKRISIAPDYFFCAKGRQIGISTANNVFAYWKTTFFGPDYHVWIVGCSSMMCNHLKKSYVNISDTGLFIHSPDNVHFISPRTMMAHDLTNKNHTYILDEFDFWDEHSLDSLSKEHLNGFLMNPVWEKELSPEQFERFKSHMIVVSSYCSPYDFFATLMSNVDDSRQLVLPSPTRGLEA